MYWLFHSITYKQKVFLKIHKLKARKLMPMLLVCLCLELSNAFTRVGTDTCIYTHAAGLKIKGLCT